MVTRSMGSLFLAIAALTACNGRSDQRAAADQGGTPHDTTTAAGGDINTPARAPTDAQIFAILTEANTGEIDAAKTALTKATHADVKAFARKMIADHTTLLNGGKALADSLQITPQPPANDSLATHVQQEKQTLSSASGASFDKAYMDAQVKDHETVLAMLQQFEGQAQNARLKAMVTAAEPIVRGHLTRAKDVDGRLASPQM